VRDHSTFTFVDLGSGKGRILFLAAEYPYTLIQGVELVEELHLQAERNIRSCRIGKLRGRRIESSFLDAMDFEFPPGNLVLYLFNPFPASTLQRVLENLAASLDRSPRQVLVVLQFPDELGHIFDELTWLRSVKRTRRHQIYENIGSPRAATSPHE
jgi:hypothetical protein